MCRLMTYSKTGVHAGMKRNIIFIVSIGTLGNVIRRNNQNMFICVRVTILTH